MIARIMLSASSLNLTKRMFRVSKSEIKIRKVHNAEGWGSAGSSLFSFSKYHLNVLFFSTENSIFKFNYYIYFYYLICIRNMYQWHLKFKKIS